MALTVNRRIRLAIIVTFILVSGLVAPGFSRVSQAAGPFIVDSIADTVDAIPGDGNCEDVSGDCTLRAAIMEANASAGPDTITVPAGTYILNIEAFVNDGAEAGDLDITESLTITGAGQAVTEIKQGWDEDRIFQLLGDPASPIDVEIVGLTLSDAGGLTVTGGAIWNGPGSNLTVRESTLTGNSGTGGALYNSGVAKVIDSTISDNHAPTYGGGINNQGILEVTGSTFTLNEAKWGGAVFQDSPTLPPPPMTDSPRRSPTAPSAVIRALGVRSPSLLDG